MTTTAKTHALRYRIWAYCQPREWDCTTHEIADGIGLGRQPGFKGTPRWAK